MPTGRGLSEEWREENNLFCSQLLQMKDQETEGDLSVEAHE